MDTRRYIPVGVLLATALTACSPQPAPLDDAPSPTATTTVSAESSAAATATERAQASAPAALAHDADTATAPPARPTDLIGPGERSHGEGSGAPDLTVTDVRTGSHGDFDRVVIEFAGTGTPGWFAEMTPNPTQQASGRPIAYEGTQAIVLSVYFVPYSGENGAEIPQPGPAAGPAGHITGVRFDSNFEANSQYVIGLDTARSYRVTTATNPTRVIVDVYQ